MVDSHDCLSPHGKIETSPLDRLAPTRAPIVAISKKMLIGTSCRLPDDWLEHLLTARFRRKESDDLTHNAVGLIGLKEELRVC